MLIESLSIIKEIPQFEVIRNVKFNLNGLLHKSRNKYLIYIRVESVKRLFPIIYKYILPSIRYKFDIILWQKKYNMIN